MLLPFSLQHNTSVFTLNLKSNHIWLGGWQFSETGIDWFGNSHTFMITDHVKSSICDKCQAKSILSSVLTVSLLI